MTSHLAHVAQNLFTNRVSNTVLLLLNYFVSNALFFNHRIRIRFIQNLATSSYFIQAHAPRCYFLINLPPFSPQRIKKGPYNNRTLKILSNTLMITCSNAYVNIFLYYNLFKESLTIMQN